MPQAVRPRVSVVIASRNGAATLPACLAAVGRQQLDGTVEVLVVDDGSDDATADVARQHGARVVVHDVNRGVSAARNTGIAASVGDVVAFTDDDCIPDKRWLAAHLEAHERPGVAGVGGPLVAARLDTFVQRYLADHNPLAPLELDLERHPSLVGRLGLYLRRMWAPARAAGSRPVYAFPSANMSFHRALLEDVGGFDERLTFGGEDEDLCRRVRARRPGEALYFEERAVVAHDFGGTVRDLCRRSYAYGKGHARAYRLDPGTHRWPIVFPFPVLVVLATAALVRARHARLAPLLVALLYPQGILGVRRHRAPVRIVESWLRLAEEAAHDAGMAVGLLRSLGARGGR